MLRRQNGKEEDDEELQERIPILEEDESGGSPGVGVLEIDDGKNVRLSWQPSRSMMVAIATLLCTIVLLIHRQSTGQNVVRRDKDDLFSCPVIENQEATYIGGEDFEETYGDALHNTAKKDKDEFLRTFRTEIYDGWGKTYNKVKKGMTPFKTKFFLPYLKPGMKIYESACGIGLNLFMTLEILQESQISGITVYGNEYNKEAVGISEMVLGQGVIPAGNRRGVICTGDSTNLSHVPSNAFDLVYSGYITAMQNPLNLDPDIWEKYDAICDSLESNAKKAWMGKKLWEMGVKKQWDWYGKWVGEMARIAKPGAPIIVEQLSVSYCTNQKDWDGIDKDFWFEAAKENLYNWNVDPNSIQMMRDTLHLKRYHVFMLKKADE